MAEEGGGGGGDVNVSDKVYASIDGNHRLKFSTFGDRACAIHRGKSREDIFSYINNFHLL